ncbi:hypothetical protein [Eikenella halliae]|nr:hypothetical protein [Eikenella halliae]
MSKQVSGSHASWRKYAYEAAFGSWQIDVGDGVSLVFGSNHG